MKVTLIIRERYDMTDAVLTEQLKKAGFKTIHLLETVGSIVGEIDEANLSNLDNIDAVAWVES